MLSRARAGLTYANIVAAKRRRYLPLGLAGVVTALALPASASAEVTFNERVPVAFISQNCEGEQIPVEGTLHGVVRDNGSHGNVHLTGVDSSSDEYVQTGIENNVDLDANFDGNGATGFHFVSSRHQIRTGRSEPGDDAYYHEVAHFVITPSGHVVGWHHQDFGCR
jgi:hypothetical protein